LTGGDLAVNKQRRTQAVEEAAKLCDRDDDSARRTLENLWDDAFEQGRVQALDELQDRFCVCMK
jgi:hypothetical protein